MSIASPRSTATARTDAADRDDSRFLTLMILGFLLVAFYYLSYRYPLKFNASDTSPTYSDTPALLQLGKYVILGALTVLTLLHLGWRVRAHRVGAVAAQGIGSVILLVAQFAMAKGALGQGLDVIGVGVTFLIPVALLTLQPYLRWEPERIGRAISFFAVAAIAFDAYQYMLYRTQGRLPALAYVDSASVRFGSFFDDPNGFACITTLLIPVIWFRWKRRPLIRAALLAAIVWCLTLTQSFTGTATVFGVTAVIVLLANSGRPVKQMAYIITGGIVSIIVLQRVLESRWFQEILATKQGSIEAHSESLYQAQDIDLIHLSGLSPSGSQTEVGWILSLLNLGAPWTIGIIALGLISFRRLLMLYRTAPTDGTRGVFLGFASFQLMFLVASFNLPLIVVFPINLIFALGVALSLLVPRFPGDAAPLPDPRAAGRT